MNYAIEILEKELSRINSPSEGECEEDIYDAVLSSRRKTDILLAIKYLNQMKENTQELMKIDHIWKR